MNFPGINRILEIDVTAASDSMQGVHPVPHVRISHTLAALV